MELRVIRIGALNDFVKEPAFAILKNLPIIPLRSFSQSQNPNASLEDPALVVAYNEEKEILAFLGCIPDVIRNAGTEKICWNSGWWAHPEKGNIAVMPVFYKGLQLWKGKMLFDALPKRSKEILERMGHFSFLTIDGMLAYGRFKFHKILPARKPALSFLKSLFYLSDQILSLPIKMRIAWWKRKNTLPKDVELIQLTKIDQSAFNFIQKHNSKDLLHRSEEGFNWPIDFPWLSQDQQFKNRYHFSSFASRFENILLLVRQDQKSIGFVWLTFRDGTVKLPYCYVDPGKEKLITQVIVHQLAQLPFEAFISYQKNIHEALENTDFPFTLKKKTTKDFGWSKMLDAYIPKDVYIQDGDGDGVFT